MKRLLLLRHGLTEANLKRLYCGSTDLSLCEEGRAELYALRAAGGYPAPEGFRFYTSGMRRTEETLSILCGSVDRESVPDLREMDFGQFEMRGYEELKDDPAYRAWCEGENGKNLAPGGESGEIMTRRVIAAVEKLLAQEGDVCIVTHGGPIAAVMARFFPQEEKTRYQWQPANGCGYLIELDGSAASWRPVPEEGKKMSDKRDWEGKAFSFFQNRECEYFPCHKTSKPEDFNCLFCYCPLYALGENCGGNYSYSSSGVKVCTKCLFPHVRKNYGKVIERFHEIALLAAKKEPDEK